MKIRGLPPSVFALVLANAFPLVAVLFLHWTVFAVILLYWCENVVIGVFNVLRMLAAYPAQPAVWIGKVFLIPFFCVHYGMFTFVHGIFVVTLFGGPQWRNAGMSPAVLIDAVRRTGLGWAVAALAASHAFSFLHNYIGGGEYKNVNPIQLMTQPYVRVVVLHITILAAGFLVLALGAPLPGLLLLIVLKTAVDLRAHLAERAKHAGVPAKPLSPLAP